MSQCYKLKSYLIKLTHDQVLKFYQNLNISRKCKEYKQIMKNIKTHKIKDEIKNIFLITKINKIIIVVHNNSRKEL